MPGPTLNRRTALATVAAAASQPLLAGAVRGQESASKRSEMGLVVYCCGIRRRQQRAQSGADLFEPLRFLRHCLKVGAGGAQIPLGALKAEKAKEIREVLEANQLFLEASIRPPRSASDIDRFESEVRTAVATGAGAARTVVMPGRRYEQFKTRKQFKESEQQAKRMLELAAPIVEKHRMPLAVENHKDQRLDERVDLLQTIASEFVGACVDTGNSVALLDDPQEVVEALAPFAFAVHLKDQALQAYDDGFLLDDIPLGQGSLDLPRMVNALRRVKPDIRFALELITRDPLKVPCLTAPYWATMPTVYATDLANTLRLVRDRRVEKLQYVTKLPLDKQVQLETANVEASLAYARDTLKI